MTNTSFSARDMLDGAIESNYDGIFSLDVLEHIQKEDENVFMKNICGSLSEDGSVIIGMPSLESQVYASEPSKIGHVNCKTAPDLKALMEIHFKNVFLFSMNDEVLHTGFHPMSHYLLALCCTPR
jgi:2-polyprenyl-3-methyl-5-hydroxy-6-metoxy-1,4-benzoquinol methylase